MKHIASLSGGKDSTAMLLMMLEKGMQVDEVIFCDTTKEFPAMYRHLNKLENSIGMPITKVSFDFDYWFKDHVKVKGKNKGQKGYGWPEPGIRWCTAKKRDLINGCLSGDYILYLGIAYDEKHRIEGINDKRNVKYPLIDWKITEKQALDYCWRKGYNWGGLYKKMSRVSCYLCPLQRLSEIEIVYNEYPLLWDDMTRLDEYANRDFRNDYTLEELERKFEIRKRRMALF